MSQAATVDLKEQRHTLLSTYEIAGRLGFVISVAAIKRAGVQPVFETRSACYWRKDDYPLICISLSRYLCNLYIEATNTRILEALK